MCPESFASGLGLFSCRLLHENRHHVILMHYASIGTKGHSKTFYNVTCFASNYYMYIIVPFLSSLRQSTWTFWCIHCILHFLQKKHSFKHTCTINLCTTALQPFISYSFLGLYSLVNGKIGSFGLINWAMSTILSEKNGQVQLQDLVFSSQSCWSYNLCYYLQLPCFLSRTPSMMVLDFGNTACFCFWIV